MPRVRWCATAVLLLAAMSVVSSAQALPNDPAAKVVSLTGAVSVLKDNQPWALSVGDSVQVKQVIVSGPDGHAVFQVSDGSTFEVFPNSYITFRKNPGSWRDLIDVMVGRVRVHIQRWGNQPNPNKIYTPTAVISVRGTTFEVVVREEDESTIVQVEEGQVAVQHALLPRGNPKVLNTGESITVYKNEPLEARMIDKGSVARYVLRALMDALGTSMSSGGGSIPRAPGGVPGGGGGTIGDTQRPDPPPPPPPPPPQ
jgi:ferric-dicitrate binding protein FerR (iron transport regulator)